MTLILDRTTPFQARVADQLQRELIGWLTTVSPNSIPQPSPIWFIWNGADEVTIFSRPDAPRLRNIAQNPNVTFHFDSDARGEHVAIFSGTATIHTGPPSVTEFPGYVEKYHADLLIIGSTPAEMDRDFTTRVVVKFDRLRGQ